MGVNNYGIPGAYVPPAGAGGAAPGMQSGGPGYAPDAYYNPGYSVPPGQPGVPQQGQKPINLMMVASLAIGGFMLFGPIGAVVGGLIGLFLGK
jgi:hypothetical protein